jgi:hypothetical protein
MIKKLNRSILVLLAAGLLLLPLTACKQKEQGPMETLGESVDDAVDEIKDNADDLGDELEDAGEDLEDAADDLGDKLEDLGDEKPGV